MVWILNWKDSIAYLLSALVAIVLVPAPVTADSDPYLGTFVQKDNGRLNVVRKLVFLPGEKHAYDVELHISRFIHDGSKTGTVMRGYAEVYRPSDDKTYSMRIFAHFPEARFTPFLEIYPGQRSSPVRNSKGYMSVRYSYFENAPSHRFVSGELFRK